MKKSTSFLLSIVFALTFTGLIIKAAAAQDGYVLARVEFADWKSIENLPVYAML
ncbi:MAG: hypothetical protein GYA34_18865 [Chloroflexi bacterium]|nr:hypothetical protein [Chloroflexota bacterium]